MLLIVQFFVPRKQAFEKNMFKINITLGTLYLIATPRNVGSLRVQGVSF